MLSGMDAREKYSGMMKDNTIGGARIVRTSRGQAVPGQEELRAQLYTMEQNVGYTQSGSLMNTESQASRC